MEKDLRVRILDYEGNLAAGNPFELEIKPKAGSNAGKTFSVTDDDRDGLFVLKDLEPGDYEVIDSDPETWSCNSGSGNTGFAELRGEIMEGSGDTSGNDPVRGDRDAYRDSFEDPEELHTYLLQSMTYDDGLYGPSGICEAVHVRFNDKAGIMEIYEYGLFDEPDMIFPWDSDIKVPKGEYDDGDYHIRVDMNAVADGGNMILILRASSGLMFRNLRKIRTGI